MRTNRRGSRAWVAVGGLLLLGACSSGGGGGDVTARTGASPITAPPSEIVPYCEATQGFVAFLYNTYVQVGVAPPDQVPSVARELGTELQSGVAAVLTEAPAEIQPPLQALSEGIDAMVANGDGAVLWSEPVAKANAELHTFNSENCGWPIIRLVARRGPLVGVPQQPDPGTYSFRVRNDDDEPIQVDLYEEDPVNADRSIEEQLPQDRVIAPQGVRLAASSVVRPGGDAYLLVKVEPGEYAFVLADPAASVGRARQFVPGTVTTFRVVEG